ncbi:MAG TPA: prepilin-type N-terminal cleavage/methylation domain-containing protein, partial [Mycobacteriales bacterium]|nr:prepilin-type N-terminal cleavage/methylation domain-containing protein [Mycobacteriales bacterium]
MGVDGGSGVLWRWLRGEAEDAGFTLIELMVIIIIIGILMAISIRVFLDQRSKAYDAAAKSDLRNVADFEEIYLNDYGTYADWSDLIANEPTVEDSANVVTTIVHLNGAQSYCLSAKHDSSSNTWYYDSAAGGIQPRGVSCPVT